MDEDQQETTHHIFYKAKIDGFSYWECTCGDFLETEEAGEDRMLSKVLKHARKTGHTINPRGTND